MKTPLDQSSQRTQHLQQRVFSHPDGVINLVDNNLVQALNWELFLKRVEAVFKARRGNGIYMSEIKQMRTDGGHHIDNASKIAAGKIKHGERANSLYTTSRNYKFYLLQSNRRDATARIRSMNPGVKNLVCYQLGHKVRPEGWSFLENLCFTKVTTQSGPFVAQSRTPVQRVTPSTLPTNT